MPGVDADSTDDEIQAYTSPQSVKPRIFLVDPPSIWVVFIREGGDRARLWRVLENRGEVSNDGALRTFDLVVSGHLANLRNRFVIDRNSPRTWRLNGPTAGGYPVIEIADAQPGAVPRLRPAHLQPHAAASCDARAPLSIGAHGALVGRGCVPHHRCARRSSVRRQGRRSRELGLVPRARRSVVRRRARNSG